MVAVETAAIVVRAVIVRPANAIAAALAAHKLAAIARPGLVRIVATNAAGHAAPVPMEAVVLPANVSNAVSHCRFRKSKSPFSPTQRLSTCSRARST